MHLPAVYCPMKYALGADCHRSIIGFMIFGIFGHEPDQKTLFSEIIQTMWEIYFPSMIVMSTRA